MSSPWDPRQPPQYGQQQPHGQQPYQPTPYQGFGAFEHQQQQGWQSPYPPPQPPKKPRGPLILALVIATVATLALLALITVRATGLGDQGGSVASPPTHSSKAHPTTVETPSSVAPAKSQQQPLTPGWQVVDVPQRGAVYDVPPNWQVDPDSARIYGYGTPQDSVTASGVAAFQPGFCPGQPNSYRATAGATARGGPNDATVAAETSQKFVALAYTRNGIAPAAVSAPPENIQLPGGIPAVRINTQVTLPTPDPCDAPVVAITVVATHNDGKGSVVFIAAADQGLPDSVTPEALNQVSGSLRAR